MATFIEDIKMGLKEMLLLRGAHRCNLGNMKLPGNAVDIPCIFIFNIFTLNMCEPNTRWWRKFDLYIKVDLSIRIRSNNNSYLVISIDLRNSYPSTNILVFHGAPPIMLKLNTSGCVFFLFK